MLAGIFGTLRALVLLPIRLVLLPFKLVSLVVSIVFYLVVLGILAGILFLFVL
ncbi:MAG: hypothetical protein V5A55_02815 [Halovenus sp.]